MGCPEEVRPWGWGALQAPDWEDAANGPDMDEMEEVDQVRTPALGVFPGDRVFLVPGTALSGGGLL